MVGNSASMTLNSTLELPVELWRIVWKKLYAFSRYTAFNNYYFNLVLIIAHVRPFLANPVTYGVDQLQILHTSNLF